MTDRDDARSPTQSDIDAKVEGLQAARMRGDSDETKRLEAEIRAAGTGILYGPAGIYTFDLAETLPDYGYPQFAAAVHDLAAGKGDGTQG